MSPVEWPWWAGIRESRIGSGSSGPFPWPQGPLLAPEDLGLTRLPCLTRGDVEVMLGACVEAIGADETPWYVIDSISEEVEASLSSAPVLAEEVSRSRGWLVGLGVLGRLMPEKGA